MRQGSIALRLFWFSLCWLIVALAFTAFLLTNLYSRALDNTLQETLEFHLETLVGVSLSGEDDAFPASSLADPRFQRPASGWYWEIRDAEGNITGFSPSLIGTILPEMQSVFDADNVRTDVQQDGFGTQIRMLERKITLADRTILISVTGNLDEMFDLVDNFRGQTLIVLGAVGVMLAVMSGLVARFALRPIGRLRRAVEQVREGESEQVEGIYPQEIAPLAEEVNELLRSNTQIIERARSQVGNLAHGLKTPLAVLRNEAAGGSAGLGDIVLSETDKMAGLVSSYLDRARLAARTAVVGRRANVTSTMDRLVRVMGKLHRDRTISLNSGTADEIWFRGEESDLEEMAGNLLDNASKWAKSAVEVTLVAPANAPTRILKVIIEDDGPGLSDAEAEKALRRGVRLDEKTPGSGLGLDIVKELVDVYGGTLSLGRSDLGGLKAELVLPAARGVAS
ncbi:ATP-binding protein [Mariluticola halotolerans]|uniref:ATP-binding protein n=1 Tax=Mariluticola halotolerans TaxID=2909283 RepID=UPI0026E43C81|nr:ATP-binding protein [Mariluticola halotolerans]UJQ95718.1 ATP-binding protein [Mariluticola halotolerans]